MNSNAIERVMWEIASAPATYKADPDAFLDRFELAAEERKAIQELDVHAILGSNANPMLTMRTWTALEGRERLPEYLRRLNEHPTAT